MATSLVRDYDESRIQQKVEDFDYLRRTGSKKVSKNPPGYLVNSIRKDYQPGQQPAPKTVDVGRSVGSRTLKDTKTPANRFDRRARAEKAKQQKIRAYRSGLSSDDALQLEKEAFEQATSMSLDGYRRASTSGNDRRLQQYREIIIETHVRTILGLSLK